MELNLPRDEVKQCNVALAQTQALMISLRPSEQKARLWGCTCAPKSRALKLSSGNSIPPKYLHQSKKQSSNGRHTAALELVDSSGEPVCVMVCNAAPMLSIWNAHLDCTTSTPTCTADNSRCKHPYLWHIRNHAVRLSEWLYLRSQLLWSS